MRLSGATYAGLKEATSVTEVDEGVSEDYDVAVATRRIGLGQLAFFGDVNCERGTSEFVAAFCSVPAAPELQEMFRLSPEDYSEVVRIKNAGNESFKVKDYPAACDHYTAALGVYGESMGCPGDERGEKVKILSNLSETLLRLNRHADAEVAASSALELDGAHLKSRFRRAKALVGLAKKTQLLDALSDVEKLEEASSDETTLSKAFKVFAHDLRASLRLLKKQESSGLRRAFASGGAGLGVDVPSSPDAPSPVGSSGSAAPMSHASWAQGLHGPAKYEWLVDCYRMRADDDVVWGSGYAHGLYDPDVLSEEKAKVLVVLEDFLVFSKLALARGVIPSSDWSWDFHIRAANDLLLGAFDKEDAKEKYGQENVFMAAMGGRSLRATAEVVYNTSIMEENSDELSHVTRNQVNGAWNSMFQTQTHPWFYDQEGNIMEEGHRYLTTITMEEPCPTPEIFDDVGGLDLWKWLFGSLYHGPLPTGMDPERAQFVRASRRSTAVPPPGFGV